MRILLPSQMSFTSRMVQRVTLRTTFGCTIELREATWLLTGTGHGKSARDGIGGTIKHHATTCNLRSAEQDVMIAEDLVKYLSPRLKRITLLHLCAKEVASFCSKKEEWQNVPPQRGIQSSHMWLCRSLDTVVKESFLARTAESEPRSVFHDKLCTSSVLVLFHRMW